MSRRKYIPAIIDQYVDEIPFLYLYRKNAAVSPAYVVEELAELDDRLDAHVSGLLLIGGQAWQLCQEQLAPESAENVFTLSLVAIHLQDPGKLYGIVDRLEGDAQLNAVADAFAYFNYPQIKDRLTDLFRNGDHNHRYIVARALRSHRQSSEAFVQAALQGAEGSLLREVILHVGVMGFTRLSATIQPFTKRSDRGVAFAACWSAARFGNTEALRQLETFVTDPEYGDTALQYVVMQKDVNRCTEILRDLYQQGATQRRSVRGLGWSGKTLFVKSLLTIMEDPTLARVAGQAFNLLTGLPLVESGFTLEPPPGFTLEPTDTPEDTNVEPDPDIDLPWPNAARIEQWWQQQQTNFNPDERYILGREMGVSSLRDVLLNGNQYQRRFSAKILGLYQRKRPLINTMDSVQRQFKQLEQLRIAEQS